MLSALWFWILWFSWVERSGRVFLLAVCGIVMWFGMPVGNSCLGFLWGLVIGLGLFCMFRFELGYFGLGFGICGFGFGVSGW